MYIVALTAIGVGGATVIGALLGFVYKKSTHKTNDIILSFAAGIMLSAAFLGLILPALSKGGKFGIAIVAIGVFVGAFCLDLIDKAMPHLHRIAGVKDAEHHKNNSGLNKVLLFVIAIAIHNLPEGVAAGVSFGSQNVSQALSVSAGIALQNIPEGMVIIAPLLGAGMSKKRTFIIALMTGGVEVLGTFIGYFAANISEAILPFALSFAGGTMLYVISDEMIPETHSHGNEKAATYSLLLGFCVMLAFDTIMG